MTVAQLRRARVSDDPELAEGYAEHERAWAAHAQAGGSIHSPTHAAVRAANDHIGRVLTRLMATETERLSK